MHCGNRNGWKQLLSLFAACKQVTDLLLEMVAKAARQDQAFLIDLAALQEKHIETAKLLLGDGPALNKFAARLLDDIGNLKAMLHAISIGRPS